MITRRSQRDLIQEQYYPDEFRVLTCCILLNRTKGEQVRSVVDELFQRWPSAQALSGADLDELRNILKPLGFGNRRAITLKKFATEYLRADWEHAVELHGVGCYAARCWEIFFLEELGDDPPDDSALNDYWVFAKSGGWNDDGTPI